MSSIEKTIIFIFFITIVIPSSIVHACTGFYVVDKAGTILAGKNEDYFNPNTKMWFVPSENGKYGKVYFGFDDYFPQGGMNEKGLFFDAFATEPLEVVNSGDKPFYMGNLTDKVMSECSTIEEVIEVYKTYNLKFLRNANLFFGDSKGNSVIIEGDDFIVKQGNYQISTNFHQSRIKPNEITCWRYLKADEMLKPIPNISVSLSRSILQAVHVHVTLYSNIYDLKKKKLYLYHFHDFDNVIEIDLLNELKKGE